MNCSLYQPTLFHHEGLINSFDWGLNTVEFRNPVFVQKFVAMSKNLC